MSNQRKIMVLIGMLLAVNLVMGVRWYLATRSTSASNSCVNNLRQIIAAKEQWAQEHHKTTNDVPSWEEIRPYLAGELVCPQHGTYACGRVGDPPTCSLGGREHTLPPN
jgi:hypothetical protein